MLYCMSGLWRNFYIAGHVLRAYLDGLRAVQLCANVRTMSIGLPVSDASGLYGPGRLHAMVNLAWILPPGAWSVHLYLDTRLAAENYRSCALFDVGAWAYFGECLASMTVRDVVVTLVVDVQEVDADPWPVGFVCGVVRSWARYQVIGALIPY